MDSDVQALLALEPTSASQSDYQDAVDSIQSDWDDMKSDASNLASVNMSTLDSAWDDFKSAVDDVPDDASVSDALNDVGTAATVVRLHGQVDPRRAGLLVLLERREDYPCRPARGPAGFRRPAASHRGSPGMNHRSRPEGSS